MDLAFVISVLAFFGAVKLATSINKYPLLTTFIAVGIPYLATVATSWVFAAGYNLPILETVFSLPSLVIITLQSIAAFFLFKRINNEDSLATTVGWSLAGFVVIILGIPYAVEALL